MSLLSEISERSTPQTVCSFGDTPNQGGMPLNLQVLAPRLSCDPKEARHVAPQAVVIANWTAHDNHPTSIRIPNLNRNSALIQRNRDLDDLHRPRHRTSATPSKLPPATLNSGSAHFISHFLCPDNLRQNQG